MRVVAEDTGFCEGPVIARDGRLLVVSIDRGQVLDLTGGAVACAPGGGPNGMVEGRDGLFVAQNGGEVWPATRPGRAGVQHIAADGTVRQVCAGMVAPNDLALGPDGMLYVTDPTRSRARDDGRLWRVDPARGTAELLFHCDWFPNGIGFGPDPGWIHIADTRNARIVRVPLDDPREARLETVVMLTRGTPDGFAFDAEGGLVIAGVGRTEDDTGCVEVWDRKGKGRVVEVPGASRFVTNIALDRDGAAFVCDSGNGRVLAFDHGIPALPLHPFRDGDPA